MRFQGAKSDDSDLATHATVHQRIHCQTETQVNTHDYTRKGGGHRKDRLLPI